ncbi:sulfotransferase family 2 domain-containing protein [Nocardioides campestrisoli]|uniref:sulfotransferase family 2 domain-containing protein n=1 Tax=Nocardioides campestrisoli TaxID=2736757 RepID=UPI0015E6F45F|nr:sulfotransferase family 2 domain-containing protein [Nocardioides campestrisoli]
MLISDAHRLLFIHVPKTGGVTVESVVREGAHDLRDLGPRRHPRLRWVLQQEPGLAGYWTFGFVRNPWSRMVSWWSMIDRWNHRLGPASGKPQVEQDGPRGGNPLWRAVAKYADFEEFVLRGTEEHPRLATPQVDFLVTPRRRADHIGRTERLAADLAVVQKRLGLPVVDPPRRNTWSTGPWQDYYDDRTRRRVAEVYARDLTEFGYTFD